MGLLFACVGAIFPDAVRAHIFDMYTREHSINPTRKRDGPTTVFAFSRKSPIRTVMISRLKIPRDFSRARGDSGFWITIVSIIDDEIVFSNTVLSATVHI